MRLAERAPKPRDSERLTACLPAYSSSSSICRLLIRPSKVVSFFLCFFYNPIAAGDIASFLLRGATGRMMDDPPSLLLRHVFGPFFPCFTTRFWLLSSSNLAGAANHPPQPNCQLSPSRRHLMLLKGTDYATAAQVRSWTRYILLFWRGGFFFV